MLPASFYLPFQVMNDLAGHIDNGDTVLCVDRSGTDKTDQAPFGSAQSSTRFAEGTAVRIERQEGAWRLVSRGALRGWVLASEVSEL